MFLNYASFIVLKEVVTKEQYEHFMLYFCAIRLFSFECYREHWPAAHLMLKQFVAQYATIYGQHRITSNVQIYCMFTKKCKNLDLLLNFLRIAMKLNYRISLKPYEMGIKF